MLEAVKEKLENEKRTAPGSRRAAAVRDAVCLQLIAFCEQSDEFCQAVLDSDKTINDCCEEIMHGVGSCISDVEVYRRMAAYFFPGCGVEMTLTINLSADADGAPLVSHKRKAVIVNLFDLL